MSTLAVVSRPVLKKLWLPTSEYVCVLCYLRLKQYKWNIATWAFISWGQRTHIALFESHFKMHQNTEGFMNNGMLSSWSKGGNLFSSSLLGFLANLIIKLI